MDRPGEWARVKIFKETSPENQVREVRKGGPWVLITRTPADPADPAKAQPVAETVVSTHDTEAEALAALKARGQGAEVFDQKRSNQRAGTLASGIRAANKGEAGSLRLQDGGWDALSRANRVWAVFYPGGIDPKTGQAFVPHANRKSRKRDESVDLDQNSNGSEGTPLEGVSHVEPDPAAVAAANEAPAFADEDSEEASWT